MAGRFVDWLASLTAKTSTIDGTETSYISSSGTSLKATTLDIIRYVLSSGFSATDLSVANKQYLKATAKTLTESSATGLVDIALSAGVVSGGQLLYTVEANDATNYQCLTSTFTWGVVNKGGVLTSVLSPEMQAVAVSSGTLTCNASAVAGTNKITLSLTAVSSLTQTTLRCKWQLFHDSNAVITAL